MFIYKSFILKNHFLEILTSGFSKLLTNLALYLINKNITHSREYKIKTKRMFPNYLFQNIPKNFKVFPTFLGGLRWRLRNISKVFLSFDGFPDLWNIKQLMLFFLLLTLHTKAFYADVHKHFVYGWYFIFLLFIFYKIRDRSDIMSSL